MIRFFFYFMQGMQKWKKFRSKKYLVDWKRMRIFVDEDN